MTTKKKKKKKVLRTDRLIALLAIVLLLFSGLIYGGYRLFRVFVPVQAEPEVVVPPKDSTSETVSADHSRQIETIKQSHALDTVNVTGFTDEELRSLFYSSELDDEILSRITGTTYSADQSFITPEDLRYVRVLYKDFSNSPTVGELIVNQTLASDVEEIFYDLYMHDYQIEKMILPDAYGGDDELSMSNNNTSSFSMRFSDGVSLWPHEHALGLAIDLNPLYNPFVMTSGTSQYVSPESGTPYADRSNLRPHMISTDDYAYQVFTAHGFTWGGTWTERTDYQHFEKGYTAPSADQLPADVVEKLNLSGGESTETATGDPGSDDTGAEIEAIDQQADLSDLDTDEQAAMDESMYEYGAEE